MITAAAVFVAWALALLVLAPSASAAAAGSIDPTFNSGAWKTFDASTPTLNADAGYDVAVQPLSGGKLLVAGTVLENGGRRLAVMRFAANGSIDTTWGGDGVVTVGVHVVPSNTPVSLAVQSDGKVVVAGTAGTASTDFLVARFKADGTVDTTFDTFSNDGNVLAHIGNDDTTNSVTLLPDPSADDRILLAGSRAADMAIVEISADGLSVAQWANPPAFTGTEVGRDIAYDPGADRVYVVGSTTSASVDVAVARWVASTGAVDTAWQTQGTRRIDLAPSLTDTGRAVAVQSDGKIVIGAAKSNGANDDIVLLRLNTDGSNDTNGDSDPAIHWDTDGIAMPSLSAGQDDAVHDVDIDSTGRVVAVGSTVDAGTLRKQVAVLRLRSDGTLDTDFDGDGIVTTGTGATHMEGLGIGVDASDNALVAGAYDINAAQDTLLVRYLGTGVVAAGTLSVDTSACLDSSIDFGELMPGAAIATSVDCVVSFSSSAASGATLKVTRSGANTVIVPAGAAAIGEYASSTADWTTGPSMFGICLRAGGTATPTWSTGTCTAYGTGWRRVPPMGNAAEESAASTSSPTPGSAQFRFGVRIPLNQLVGNYSAPIVFTAVPNA